MKIRGKLLTAFIALSLIGAIVGVAGLFGLIAVTQTLHVITNEEVPLAIIMKDYNRERINIRAQTNSVYQYETQPVGVALDDVLRQRAKSFQLTDEVLNTVEKLLNSEEEIEEIRRLTAANKAWRESYILIDKTISEITLARTPEEKAKLFNDYRKYVGIMIPISDNLGSIALEAEKNALASMHFQEDASDALALSLEMVLLALTLAGFFISLALGIIIAQSLVKPIQAATAIAGKIALGDISEKVPPQYLKREDEIADLATAFVTMLKALMTKEGAMRELSSGNLAFEYHPSSDVDSLGNSIVAMTDNLNDLLHQVAEAIEQVAAGSDQVATASQALSQGATEQASSMEEIGATVTEISSQSKQNTEGAMKVTKLAKTASSTVNEGNEKMQGLVLAIQELNSSAEGIRNTVKVIDDIAFQINLLALNANVEAARAGKYGKGFGVVAEEVRNLAGRSAGSVNDTTNIVQDILSKLKTSTEMVESTAAKIKEVGGVADQVAVISDEVAAASREQTSGLEQISTGLDQIDQVTQSNTASAEESASAAEELAGQATQLRALIRQFTLKQDYQNKGETSKATRQSEPVRQNPTNKLGVAVPKSTRQPDATPQSFPTQTKPPTGPSTPVTQVKKTVSSRVKVDPKRVIALDDDDFEGF